MNILIIGAGPSGLATAAELKKAGLDYDHDEGIAERIRSGTEVVAVEAADGGGYLVTLRGAGDAGPTETRRYDHVICASGTLSVPNLPDIPGDFAGEYRHSATYRGIDELRGKRVLVIGAGDPAPVLRGLAQAGPAEARPPHLRDASAAQRSAHPPPAARGHLGPRGCIAFRRPRRGLRRRDARQL